MFTCNQCALKAIISVSTLCERRHLATLITMTDSKHSQITSKETRLVASVLIKFLCVSRCVSNRTRLQINFFQINVTDNITLESIKQVLGGKALQKRGLIYHVIVA